MNSLYNKKIHSFQDQKTKSQYYKTYVQRLDLQNKPFEESHSMSESHLSPFVFLFAKILKNIFYKNLIFLISV